MKRLGNWLKDGWFQCWLVLALAGAGLAAAPHWPAPAAAPPAGAGAASAPLSSPAAAIPSPSGTLAAPMVSGPGFSAALTSKKPGEWIVDKKRASDSDTDSFRDAAANARDGDRIIVRPGTYEAGVKVAGSLTILGQPTAQEPVVLESSDKDTLWVKQGDFRAENITLLQKKGYGKALWNDGANLVLKRVELRAPEGAGLVTKGGSLRCEECTASGNKDAGITLAGEAGPAEIVNSKFEDNRYGIYVEDKAKGVHVAGSEFRGNYTALNLVNASLTKVDKAVISKSRAWSVYLQGDAEAEMTDCQVLDGHGDSITLSGSSRLTFKRGKVAGGDGVGAWVSGKAAFVMEGSLITMVSQGLHLTDWGQAEVKDSQIVDVSGVALFLQSSGRLTLTRVKVNGNQRGVMASDKAALSFQDVEFRGSERDDLVYSIDASVKVSVERVTPPLSKSQEKP